MEIQSLKNIKQAIDKNLHEGLIPFWRARALDQQWGGYLTNFDENGEAYPMPEKYLNTQCRLIWWFSTMFRRNGDEQDRQLAKAGVDFLLTYFWEPAYEGWRWKVKQDGSPIDDGKVVYGQSFAIYALSEYYMATGDPQALEYAERTFDLLQKYCADTMYGGYYENLEKDWSPAPGGWCAGDRKSLDTHMHLMEAFTNLYKATNLEIHKRKLLESIALICTHMVDPEQGYGLNQFNLQWLQLPAVAIRRTWNAERHGQSHPATLLTTSYGHNTELSWLMHLALQTAGIEVETRKDIMKKLLDHAHRLGVDWTYGGIYRDGEQGGEAIVLEKEWWQNTEALVGFLDGFQVFKDQRYLDAFENIWNFCHSYMIHHESGAWKRLLSREGSVLDGTLGNEWKASYHSSRSMLECSDRLEQLIKQLSTPSSKVLH